MSKCPTNKAAIKNKIPKPIDVPKSANSVVLAKKITNIPLRGATILTPRTADTNPATAPPTKFAGIKTFGFLLVYGIAPSEINESPNKIFEIFPDSLSSFDHSFLEINIDTEIPRGGTIPEIITAAIDTVLAPLAIVNVPKIYAALLIGPPKSDTIINPKINPNNQARYGLPSNNCKNKTSPKLMNIKAILTNQNVIAIVIVPKTGMNKIFLLRLGFSVIFQKYI